MQKMDDITEDEFDSALNMTRNFLVGRTI